MLAKDASINGGNRVTLALARHLAAVGHEVIVCLSQYRGERSFSVDGLEVVDAQTALQSEYDCAICTYFSEAEAFHQLRARRKFRYVQADYWKNDEECDCRINKSNQYFADSSIQTITVSDYIQNVLKNRNITAQVVRPAIEHHEFEREPNLGEKTFRVLIEGTDNRWKRLAESRASIPQGIEVWCLSPSPVSVKADQNWVCPEQPLLPKIMSACTLIVKLSEMEGYPLILLEAMNCGVIPIVLDRGGQVDYCVDGRNALLVSSAGQVPSVIRRYLGLSQEEQAMMMANAIATARERTWHHVAAEFLRIIEPG